MRNHEGARMRVRDLVDATPSTRNRYIDLIRVVSIGAVILGHWTIAVLGFREGRFTGANLLELDPSWHLSTWVFMVMPLFFIVGGFTNAGSWISARARGERYADWVRTRSVRLVRPAFWFVVFWTVIPTLGVTIGILPVSVARVGGEEVALPLWFLAVYLVTVAAIPPLVVMHARYGVRVLWVLATGAFIVDNLHFGADLSLAGGLNYGLVWLALSEMGLLWRDGWFRTEGWPPWAMMAAGLAALAAMVTWFDYPVSMIGLTHAVRSNMQPPTLALFALGVWQLGVTLVCQSAVTRWLQRRRPWTVVVAANSMVMSLYLWNMSAVVLAALVLFRTGIAPQPDPLSTTWWLLRPAWWIACAICLVPFVLAFRWAERPAATPRPARRGRLGDITVIAGTLSAAAGMGALAARAFPVPGADVIVLPTIGVVFVGLGSLLLWVDPFAPLRAAKVRG